MSSPFRHSWQDEEHPQVDPKDQDHLGGGNTKVQGQWQEINREGGPGGGLQPTWKTSFPKTALRRYRALSTIMVLNWISSMARKASGTWSSDRVEAMSAAALCFCMGGGREGREGGTPSDRQLSDPGPWSCSTSGPVHLVLTWSSSGPDQNYIRSKSEPDPNRIWTRAGPALVHVRDHRSKAQRCPCFLKVSRSQSRRGSSLTASHPKGPESKDDDDEVDDVGEEHERVDVGGGPILGVEDAPEEDLGWMVNAVEAGGRERERQKADELSWSSEL